jgi:N-formylglutamate deformylase
VTPYSFHRGPLPLLVSIPHAGVDVPPSIRERFTAAGRDLPDTDWYVDQLYDFARELGASIIKANYSRYVVDLNRSPDSSALYAANATSPVCPTMTFSGAAIYSSAAAFSDAEIQPRIAEYWQPYHRRIAAELARIKAEHGRALLWDAHSIASEVPALFPGVLPEFNLGTRENASCPERVATSLVQLVKSESAFSAVLNGRFKGGYITMQYGRPADGVYAVQLELAQRTYMSESPRGDWERQRAQAAAACIERLLRSFVALAAVR